MELDLDALRAARLEATGATDPRHILFMGEKYELPVELPWDFAIELTAGKTDEAFRILFGDDAPRFFKARPSVPDIEELLRHLDDLYPGASGEGSGASQRSSPRTSKPSKPTSRASTA